jgi:hypothetical protein
LTVQSGQRPTTPGSTANVLIIEVSHYGCNSDIIDLIVLNRRSFLLSALAMAGCNSRLTLSRHDKAVLTVLRNNLKLAMEYAPPKQRVPIEQTMEVFTEQYTKSIVRRVAGIQPWVWKSSPADFIGPSTELFNSTKRISYPVFFRSPDNTIRENVVQDFKALYGRNMRDTTLDAPETTEGLNEAQCVIVDEALLDGPESLSKQLDFRLCLEILDSAKHNEKMWDEGKKRFEKASNKSRFAIASSETMELMRSGIVSYDGDLDADYWIRCPQMPKNERVYGIKDSEYAAPIYYVPVLPLIKHPDGKWVSRYGLISQTEAV